jgi:hemoglobin
MIQPPRSFHELPLAGRPADAEQTHQAREAEIARLVEHFYALGREDPVLGPVFESRVSDWTKHLEAMRDFWSSAIYRTGRYHGRPLEVHRRIAEIRPEHFARWLQLWELAVGETVRSEARMPLIAMARRMAETMAPKMFGPLR